MRALVADMHMHTIMSGHAFGTIREMAAEASAKGMQMIGITEHAPGIPGTCNPIYFRNFPDAPRFLYGVEILHGCEINILDDGKLSLDQHHMQFLDYAAAGIHGLCYQDQGIVKNTDNVICCMQDPKVRFITHPDESRHPLDYRALVQAAKHYRTALEVNVSSLRNIHMRPGAKDNYKKMLPLCMEYGVHIIVNTDAHDPGAVGNFTLAEKVLDSVGFDNELILNNDLNKLRAFLL